MKNDSKLIILDLDGTLIQNPLFYKTVYSQSLNDLVKELRGEKGLEVLAYCRKNLQGRGELALPTLNIPYSKWADRLERLSLDLIEKNPYLVQKIKSLPARKVIYTGSPLKLAKKLLLKTGFDLTDFSEIIGWKRPEEFPLKWTCSPFIYASILTRFSIMPQSALVIGDSYSTDIFPAEQVGIPTQNITERIFRIAGGNTTLLTNDFQRKNEIVKRSLGKVEQIGFISYEPFPTLTMMGNELCINATLAFASMLGKKGILRTSGVKEKIYYNNKKNQTIIQIPLTYKTFNNLVILPGIGFIYSENQKKILDSMLDSFCKEFNVPAFGSISYKDGRLSPLIYVKETRSLVKETSCGSGSIALNILLGIETVYQPTGDVISVKHSGSMFEVRAKVKNISLL